MTNRLKKPKTLTLDPALRDWAIARAESKGSSFSGYVAELIARERDGQIVLQKPTVVKRKRKKSSD